MYELLRIYEKVKMSEELRRKDLVYPELSYKIIEILFEVFNELGPGLQERYYQSAIAVRLKQIDLPYAQEVRVPLDFKSSNIGSYFLDFLIDGKVILEIKRGSRFLRQNIDQVVGYLKASKKKLGIIANFTNNVVKYKRILNLY
ncbi:MAG: GxxExxY protein [Candidatus Kerfeldbacteria bacterium CG08_land_8_20_14_0_20_43_14]|uniref:GxxExxY protein n=1 Tax=Candidatus Kerfeldbacteria bacterium CG08_land_8_20_14_0_20_43_14 TaxID=2014246 RepID=A0A2H0YPS2_9BACT|nr:MAG: GxxExxY protein [Candidatus Kerfeldbacteria bacterium CG08_land_8_20_14_0_20_43_14]